MEIKLKIPKIKITIGRKLLIGIIAIIVLILLIVMQGIMSVNKLEYLFISILDESEANNIAQKMKSDIERLIMPPNDYLIHGNNIEKENYQKIWKGLKTQYIRISEIDSLYSDKFSIMNLESQFAEIDAYANKIFNLEDPIGNNYGADLMEKMDSVAEIITSEINEIIISVEKEIKTKILAVHLTETRSTRIIILIGLVIIFSLLIGGFFYVKEIINPIQKLEQTTQKISSGDFSAKVEVNTHDEIEKLANSFNSMIGFLESTTVSREYFNSILNRMESSLIITDEFGNIKILNKATINLLGYNEEEMIGNSIGVIVTNDSSRKRCIGSDIVKNFLKKEQVDNVYNTYYRKNGVPIPVSFSRSLIYDKNNQLSGMIFIARSSKIRNIDDAKIEQINIEEEVRNICTGEIPLTKRESQIIKLITEGFSNLEISEKLFISVRTVETHRKNIMQKLNTKSAIALVHYAYQNNLI